MELSSGEIIKVNPNPTQLEPLLEEENAMWRHRHTGQSEVMHLQAKEHQDWQVSPETGRCKDGFSTTGVRGNMALPTPVFYWTCTP